MKYRIRFPNSNAPSEATFTFLLDGWAAPGSYLTVYSDDSPAEFDSVEDAVDELVRVMETSPPKGYYGRPEVVRVEETPGAETEEVFDPEGPFRARLHGDYYLRDPEAVPFGGGQTYKGLTYGKTFTYPRRFEDAPPMECDTLPEIMAAVAEAATHNPQWKGDFVNIVRVRRSAPETTFHPLDR